MTLATTAALVDAAVERGGAVAALNVITLEHAEAVVTAADRTGHGVIVQLSENAIRYHTRPEPLLRALADLADTASTPIAIHLDHLCDDELLTRALQPPLRDLVSSLMYDGAALPYADNLARTREVSTSSHALGLWVEAELGFVGGKPGTALSAHAPGVRTDPDEAAEFVARTRVDALAVAVGSSHAMQSRTASLDHDLIERLAAAVPVPLVLHGSSGVPDDELRSAVAHGIRKVNVGTALNRALSRTSRDHLLADPGLSDPRIWLGAGRAAMTAEVERLLEVLGSAIATNAGICEVSADRPRDGSGAVTTDPG